MKISPLMNKILLFLILVTVTHLSSAHGKVEDAFKKLQVLKGAWSIKSPTGIISTIMTYDLGSKDSIITEEFGKELSVFHHDGTLLYMTHYCNAGNQPRLKLKESSNKNILEFELFDITNLKDKTSPHVQKIVYKFLSKDHFDLEIIWKKGNSEEIEKYSLSRAENVHRNQ